jgi:hypothetical protein
MYKCLKTKNILTNIGQYLTVKDVIFLSNSHKTMNKILTPLQNLLVNLMFLEYVIHFYFQYDSDYKNKKNLLDIFRETIDWKQFLKEMKDNFRAYKNTKIKAKVLDCFKIHMYLPDLRKENNHLEFESSSISQIFFYDLLFRSTCNSNFYGKHITLEYMTEKITEEKKEEKKNEEERENLEKKENIDNKNSKEKKEEKKKEKKAVKILREGLYFEEELKDFRKTFDVFENNKDYKRIINDIINYKYENLYCEYKNNYSNYTNEIIVLLLWITNSFILYTRFVYEYINGLKKDINEKTILIEFIQKHNEIINCALLLNSNFGNINVIINQYQKYNFILEPINNKPDSIESKSNTPPKENFALYKYFLKIIKKNIYDKFFPSEKEDEKNEKGEDKKDGDKKCINLFDKFKILIKDFCKDVFENFDEKYKSKEKTMDLDDYDDINMICEDDEECMDLENFSMEKEKEPTEKETLENLFNLHVDHTINEENANGINHSELIVSQKYQDIENYFINTFDYYLKHYMNENKPNAYLFQIIETMTKFHDNERSLVRNSESLTLINRTKKRLMDKLFRTLFQKALEMFHLSFLSHIKIENGTKRIVLSSTELQNSGKYECDLKDLPSKKRMKVVENVEEEIKNLKTFLIGKYVKCYQTETEKNESEQLINDYIEEDRIENVLLVKKMIWFYYKEMGMYENKDEKVVKILKNGFNLENILNNDEKLEKNFLC